MLEVSKNIKQKIVLKVSTPSEIWNQDQMVSTPRMKTPMEKQVIENSRTAWLQDFCQGVAATAQHFTM